MIVLYLNNNSYVNSTPFEIINNFESLNEIIIRFGNVNKYFLHNSFYEIDAVINIFIVYFLNHRKTQNPQKPISHTDTTDGTDIV